MIINRLTIKDIFNRAYNTRVLTLRNSTIIITQSPASHLRPTQSLVYVCACVCL